MTSLQQRLVKTGGRLDQARTLLLAPVGREPSDAAAVCQYVGADRGVVATGGIARAVALKKNSSAIPQNGGVVAKRWFWKPGQRALGTRKGWLEAGGTIWEKILCSEGPTAGNRVYTCNRRRAKKFIPDKTEVRVLIYRDTVYFGFLCTDPQPEKIAIHTMRRDGLADGDDTVAIVLDTYGDKRTGYSFRINAAGTRIDGLIIDPEHPSFDWDGIWDARTARTDSGWSAEIEIPARTLNFTPGLKCWGLNLERFVARDRTTLRWTSPTLDSFLYDLSRAGTLTGTENLKQGRGIEFNPYAIGRMKDFFGTSSRAWQGNGGFDFTWRVTPELATVLTVNTDFAETEVDTRQVNLTRFPLFFPEKRAFFLEGANQYEFGLGLGQSFIPFFTRRIGLLEGQQIPINAGLKLNGRAGRWNLGVLDVQTRATPLAPAVNLFAGRVSYDITKKFRVGTVLTHGDPAGLRNNSLAGFDALWRTSTFRGNKNLLVGAWTAFSAGDIPRGQRAAWGFKVDYPNDKLDCLTQIFEFGDALDPALGFLPRPGTRQYRSGCSFKPRTSRTGSFDWVRQAFFRMYFNRVDNLAGTNESWSVNVTPLEFETESGEHFTFDVSLQYELLVRPFAIAPGLAIAPGGYQFNRWSLEAESSCHRQWQLGSTTRFGSFYSGTLTEWVQSATWTSARGRWQSGLEFVNNFGRLQEGNFVQRLWQSNLSFAWNPHVVLTSFIQYDTESQNVGTNTRLRWTFKPGRDLFVVWNRGWRRVLYTPDLALRPDSEFFAIKLHWTFRM